LLCFDLLTLYLYVTHTTGMPELKMYYLLGVKGRHGLRGYTDADMQNP